MERGEREEEEPKELRRERAKVCLGSEFHPVRAAKVIIDGREKNGPVEVNPRSIGFGLSKCLCNSTKEGAILI